MNKLGRLFWLYSLLLISSIQAIEMSCEEDSSRESAIVGWYPVQLQAGQIFAKIDLPAAPSIEHFEHDLDFPCVKAWTMTGDETTGFLYFSILATHAEDDFTPELFDTLLQLCGDLATCNQYLSLVPYKSSYTDDTTGEEIEFPVKTRLIDMSAISEKLLCVETLELHPLRDKRELTRTYYGPDNICLMISITGSVDGTTRQNFFNHAEISLLPSHE